MPVLGMRTTTNLATDERPKAWRLGIMDEYPDAAPLTHVTYRVGKEKVADPEFNWFERRFPTRELTVNAAGTPGASTAGAIESLTVGTNEAYNCRANDIIFNPTTLERVLVVATPLVHNVVTIKRGIGVSGAVSAWTAAQKVQVAGNANPEGSDVGGALSVNPTKYYNYCQIFRNPADLTRTLSQTLTRTGDKKADFQKNALLMHEIDKEWAFITGIASEDLTATPGPRRTTQGLIDRITTHAVDFQDAVTLAKWNAALKDVFESGSSERLFLCGSTALLALEDMARHYSWQVADIPKQDSYGMTLTKWKTTFGVLMVKEHKLMTLNSVMKDWGLVVDPDKLVYRYVEDTDWLPNRQGPGADRIIGEYLAECGVEIHEEYCHALFTNMSQFTG